MKKLIFLKYFIPIIFLQYGCQQNNKLPGNEIFPDMVHPVPYEAYSENSITADGKTMMMPVQGTVHRGQSNYTLTKTVEDAINAGETVMNPTQHSAKNAERGKWLYENYCLVCHGSTGQGDGPLIPKFPNPPSFTSKSVMAYKDGRLFHAITVGFGDMPGHAGQIYENDRWLIVNYVRELQKKK